MFFFDPTMILLLPAIIIAAWAQAKVSSNFKKYSRIPASSGMTAAQVARHLLDTNGLTDVQIERIPGNLTDHYDPRSKVLRLSQPVYSSSSLASIGVAAHEVGHAIQDYTEYAPLRWRSALVPVASFGNYTSWILLIIGILLGYTDLAMWGVYLFSAVVLFQLVTLPVEFNASSRALVSLEGGGYLTREETAGAKKVLSAAALTYVAALLMAIMQLLRMLLIVFGMRRD